MVSNSYTKQLKNLTNKQKIWFVVIKTHHIKFEKTCQSDYYCYGLFHFFVYLLDFTFRTLFHVFFFVLKLGYDMSGKTVACINFRQQKKNNNT